jgi:rubrerythrin
MNDLSDEAAREYYKNAELGISEETICVSMWREAVRRATLIVDEALQEGRRRVSEAEAMLEQEKKKLEAVLNLREVVRDALLKEFEERERKAFEAGWRDREKQISGTYPIREMAYRAFQAQLEGTFSCPICGYDRPHQHSPEEVVAYRAFQAQLEDTK